MDLILYMEAVIQNHITIIFFSEQIVSFFKESFVNDCVKRILATLKKNQKIDEDVYKSLIVAKIDDHIRSFITIRSHDSSKIIKNCDDAQISISDRLNTIPR